MIQLLNNWIIEISTIQLFNYSTIQGHIGGLRGIGDTGGTIDIGGVDDIRGTVDIGDIGDESNYGLSPSFRSHPHSALCPAALSPSFR